MPVQDSSSIEPINTVPASSIQHEWDAAHRSAAKPQVWDYAYVINKQTIGCTREHLSKVVVSRGSEITLVWTPESSEPVLPEQVPFLLEALRRNQLKEARNYVLIGVALVAAGVLLALGAHQWSFVYRNLFSVVGAFMVIEGIWRYASCRNYTQEDAASDAGAARFASWVKKKKISGYTFTLAACIVVVGVFQGSAGSIEAAGLVKPAVRNGEIWRLFTATLMHGSLMHFWFNFLALLHFAKIIEQRMLPGYVPLVFLLTGPLGSVFSVLLYPNSTSVGASGGLMGLLGLITMAAHFDRPKYPPKYVRQLIQGIVFVGVFGLVGFAFIDNAAHFGGLAGGLLLGWFLFRKNGQWAKTHKRFLKFAGAAALLGLGVIAAIAVYYILFYPR